jgi:hypothetical protein
MLWNPSMKMVDLASRIAVAATMPLIRYAEEETESRLIT